MNQNVSIKFTAAIKVCILVYHSQDIIIQIVWHSVKENLELFQDNPKEISDAGFLAQKKPRFRGAPLNRQLPILPVRLQTSTFGL